MMSSLMGAQAFLPELFRVTLSNLESGGHSGRGTEATYALDGDSKKEINYGVAS